MERLNLLFLNQCSDLKKKGGEKMNKFKKVFLTFTNKKGEVKKVNFYIDRYVYHLLNDKSVSKEFRQKFLVYEYHEYEKERIRKEKKKFLK